MKKPKLSRPFWASARGQSLVEFALVLPLLLVVAFIITEFGRALWIKNALTSAAGNGARAAIVSSADRYQAVVDSAANHFLQPMGMGTGDGGTEIEADLLDAGMVPTGASTAEYVRVRLVRDFNFIPGAAGKGDGLPTTPGGKDPKIPLGQIEIVGEATMDLQPAFGR